jgi:hypothetical protein
MYAKASGAYPADLPTVYPAFAGSVIALVAVSLATTAPTQKELAALR